MLFFFNFFAQILNTISELSKPIGILYQSKTHITLASVLVGDQIRQLNCHNTDSAVKVHI